MLLKLTTTLVVFLICAPVAQAWSWPVHGPVLQPFSYDEAHPYASGQHRGIDIGATAQGDPVIAPASGTVSFAGFVPTSGESLTIQTADGYSVTLTHLGSLVVAKGATLAEGDTVASVGSSGTPEQSVPYVHLGVRLTADQFGYLDPLGLLPAAPAPTPDPTPVPTPAPTPVPVPAKPSAPTHGRGGGLVIQQPVVAPARPAAPAPAAPVRPAHVTKPKARPTTHSRPAEPTFRWPAVDSIPGVPLAAPPSLEPHAVRSVPEVLVASAVAFVTLAASLVGVCLRRRGAPKPAETPLVSWTGALLLPDDADLLRELDAPHRARVHDDDRGHPRPLQPPERRRHVLPDGRRRACDQGLARRRRSKVSSHRRTPTRSPSRGVSCPTTRCRHRLLHPDERRRP